MYNIDYLSILILGIILGVFAIIVIYVKKHYFKMSENKYADKMQDHLYKIQNGLYDKDVLSIKHEMKDLDESQRIQKEMSAEKEESAKWGAMSPTNIVKQVNMKIDSGVSKVKTLSGDIYDEYIKPVVYKFKKMIGG